MGKIFQKDIPDKSGMKVLITGVAGFIGFHLASRLLENDIQVIGFDNLNNYYDPNLKLARLKILNKFSKFMFIKGDLVQTEVLDNMFLKEKPSTVVHLAAQAGVRYSIENPRSYIDSNLIGFFNVLEASRHNSVFHLIFASSSSVYGNQKKVPFSVHDRTDRPISLYAATKKADEIMAYAYSSLYAIPITGLRFFTVYGPWGRPDMAYFKFTDRIMHNQPIVLYNNGEMIRDFTYIDDIARGLENILKLPPIKDADGVPYRVYNMGNGHPRTLAELVDELESALGRKAKKEYLPMQAGDVYQTYADCSDLQKEIGYCPGIDLTNGIKRFADWYRAFYR